MKFTTADRVAAVIGDRTNDLQIGRSFRLRRVDLAASTSSESSVGRSKTLGEMPRGAGRSTRVIIRALTRMHALCMRDLFLRMAGGQFLSLGRAGRWEGSMRLHASARSE